MSSSGSRPPPDRDILTTEAVVIRFLAALRCNATGLFLTASNPSFASTSHPALMTSVNVGYSRRDRSSEHPVGVSVGFPSECSGELLAKRVGRDPAQRGCDRTELERNL